MIRINLLPHRLERRKAQRKHLAILAGMVAALAIGIVVLVHGVIAGYLGVQNDRNAFVKRENAKLDKDIAEIRKLRGEIASLLARKQVIERLQTDRAQPVFLLEELVRQVPDGVFIKGFKQLGLRVNMTGYAQSNARVSTLMRNISSSPHLTNPHLIEIKAAAVANKRVAEFSMSFNLKQQQPSEAADKAGAAKAAAKAAKK